MDSEQILLRLQKLKQWQKIQEERLLQQQLAERQKLIQTQEETRNSLENSDQNQVPSIVDDVNREVNKSSSDIEFQESIRMEKSAITNSEHCDVPENTANVQNDCKPVRPFLKKGVGMQRFKMTDKDIGRKRNKMPWLKRKKNNKKVALSHIRKSPDQNSPDLMCENKSTDDKLIKCNTDSMFSTDISNISMQREQLEQQLFEYLENKFKIEDCVHENNSPSQQNIEYKSCTESESEEVESQDSYDIVVIKDNEIAIKDTGIQTVKNDKIITANVLTSTPKYIENISEVTMRPYNFSSTNEESYCDISQAKNLLLNKLKELETELNTFREQNKLVKDMKENLQREMDDFQKEKASIEAKLNEDKVLTEYQLLEEREKFNKQKSMYDERLKNLKNYSSKKDRQTIKELNEEILQLKDKLQSNSSTFANSQMKLRTQIKALTKENGNLKNENDIIKKENSDLKNQVNRLQNFVCKTCESNKNVKYSKKAVVIKHPLSKARSEPNLNVVSQYAKYFSERDNKVGDRSSCEAYSYSSENESYEEEEEQCDRDNVEIDSSKNKTSDNPSEHSKNVQNKCTEDLPIRHDITDNGAEMVTFSSGLIKILSADRQHLLIKFPNGDTEEIFYNTKSKKYFYKERNIYRTVYKDGREMLHYMGNGTILHINCDGSQKTEYSNGLIHWKKPEGIEEWHHTDGTIEITNSSNEKTIKFPNGIVEFRTAEYKKCTYPDGRIKILYNDGRSECRLKDGEVRVKDKHGITMKYSANFTDNSR